MKRSLQVWLVAGALTGALGAPAHADVVLSGPDSNTGTWSTTGLSTLANAGDTVDAGGLTGISLWGLLAGADSVGALGTTYGGITTSTPVGTNGKNAILRYYLLAGSATGQSVISLGEIDPTFGGTINPAPFVAFQNTGGSLLATPQLIVPGGPGRGLSNLTSLQLLAVPAIASIGGGASTSLTLSGSAVNAGTYTKAGLQSGFAAASLVVGADAYTGVNLFSFLTPSDNETTDKIVITQATDGYEVVYALAEIDPNLGGNPNDLLPYADTGTDFPGSGVARTIFPTDNKHGRWQSNLDAIEVQDVPEPASLALFGAALLSLGALRNRVL